MTNRVPWPFLLAVLSALPSLAQAQPAPPAGRPPAARAEEAARQIAADLREARDLLSRVSDKKTRDRLELLLSRAELRASDLQKDLASLATPSRPAAIPADDLARILKGLKAEAFDNGKVSLVANLGKTRHYTCAQVRELLATFAFDDGRGEAAVLLYPQLVDPENFFQVLEVFTFDSSRQKVRQQLKLK